MNEILYNSIKKGVKNMKKKWIKYTVLASIIISLIGGMVYKVMNPNNYQNPYHRTGVKK